MMVIYSVIRDRTERVRLINFWMHLSRFVSVEWST